MDNAGSIPARLPRFGKKRRFDSAEGPVVRRAREVRRVTRPENFMLTRRSIVAMLAAAVVDTERLIWEPGRKLISFPNVMAPQDINFGVGVSMPRMGFSGFGGARGGGKNLTSLLTMDQYISAGWSVHRVNGCLTFTHPNTHPRRRARARSTAAE